MPYDIAKLTRQIQAEFALFDPRVRGEIVDQPAQNKATPEELRKLLDALGKVTDDIRAARRVVSIQWHHEHAFDSDLLQWRGRLAAYNEAVRAASPGDRKAVLWTVTAPLLLGFFGGESSDLPQQPIDAVTPFVLSNMLEESEAAQQRAWDLFLDDLRKNASGIVPTPSGIVTTLATLFGLYLGGKILFGKKD